MNVIYLLFSKFGIVILFEVKKNTFARNFRSKSASYIYLRQALGENSTKIGKISNLPISISIERTIFESAEKALKFCVGPTLASPGPMLFKVATTAVKFVV